jgi:hypothetical protein
VQLFNFDRAAAERSLADPDSALWPVNAYSDADELNALLEAAQACGAIARFRPRARIYVYPLSIAEPEPLLAADPGAGPTLLGHSLKLAEREGESPLEFTLRLLEELTDEANALAADRAVSIPRRGPEEWNLLCPRCCSEEATPLDDGPRMQCGNCGAGFCREEALVAVAEARAERAVAVAEALDALAARLNEPGECSGGDLVELASELLSRTGRPVAEERDDEGIRR